MGVEAESQWRVRELAPQRLVRLLFRGGKVRLSAPEKSWAMQVRCVLLAPAPAVVSGSRCCAAGVSSALNGATSEEKNHAALIVLTTIALLGISSGHTGPFDWAMN